MSLAIVPAGSLTMTVAARARSPRGACCRRSRSRRRARRAGRTRPGARPYLVARRRGPPLPRPAGGVARHGGPHLGGDGLRVRPGCRRRRAAHPSRPIGACSPVTTVYCSGALVVLVLEADEVAELVGREARVGVARVPVAGVRAAGLRVGWRDDDADAGVGRRAGARPRTRAAAPSRVVCVHELELVPDVRDVAAPLRDHGVVRRPGEADVDGDLEAVGEQAPREVAIGPPMTRAPRRARCHSNSSRPTVTGPATASSSRPGDGPDDAVVGEGRRARALELQDGLAGLVPKLPSTSSSVGHLVGRDRVELLLELLDGRPAWRSCRTVGWIVPAAGVPRGSPSVGPSTTLRPWRTTRGASSSSLAQVSSAGDPVGHERRVGRLEGDDGGGRLGAVHARDPERRDGRSDGVERLLELADLGAGAVARAAAPAGPPAPGRVRPLRGRRAPPPARRRAGRRASARRSVARRSSARRSSAARGGPPRRRFPPIAVAGG